MIPLRFISFAIIFTGIACIRQPDDVSMLNYLPMSKTDLLKKGYINSKNGFSKDIYSKTVNDTTIWYYYPSEEIKFYKLVRIYYSQFDSINLKYKDSLFFRNHNGDLINYKVFFRKNKNFIKLLYIHPSFKKNETIRRHEIEPQN